MLAKRSSSSHPITLEDRWFLAMTHWQLGNQVDARKSYDEAVSETTNEETISPRLDSLRPARRSNCWGSQLYRFIPKGATRRRRSHNRRNDVC